MPLRPPAPLPPLLEDTGGPRELGFRIKPKARPMRRIQDLPPWAQKALIGVGVVAFYFAARALNRFRVSFGARDVAIEALIPLIGLDAAQKEAAQQHGACFDNAYRTGWVKWQDYSFDEQKHADCVMRRVMADFQQRTRDASAAARKAEAARQPPVVARATTPRPPPPPTPPPILSRVAVGNVKVLQMARSPQVSGRVSFVAIGNAEALASVAMCSYAVTCGGQAVGLPAGQRALAPCPLTVQGAAATGALEFSVLAPAPAEGACAMELTLTDGTRPRSSTVVVPLP